MKTLQTGSIATVLMCAFGVTAAAEREPSIRVQLRESSSYERMIVATDKPVLLADLVGRADLVVEGFLAAQRSFLDADEAHIYTDSSFTLTSLVKNRRRPGMIKAGHSIVVRRESGTVVVDGLRATAIENGFPPFAEKGRYLLFLKETTEPNTYVVIAGGSGAFEAGDDLAPMLSLPGAAPRALPRQSFLGEMKALLKFSE